MSLFQALRPAARCACCQRWILNSFASSFGSSSSPIAAREARPSLRRRKQVRAFSSEIASRSDATSPQDQRHILEGEQQLNPREGEFQGSNINSQDVSAVPWYLQVQEQGWNERHSDVVTSELQEDLWEQNEKSPVMEERSENTSLNAQAASGIPWYLQVQDTQRLPEPNLFAERQRLPELPAYPPPILEPLLKQLSIDLGLDYLALFDLREISPPPALGANLIMVIGSARSEKHLHVSADRLCRWLRSNYKLTPYADGLLGRNEMKLKLKRKARRSKLLGTSGVLRSDNHNDGISTGWVCVNVGTVQDGPRDVAIEDRTENEGFVGFGKQIDGARIVVQMMTEEKRGDVDLESLWQGILDRSTRNAQYDREAQEEINNEDAEATHGLEEAKRLSQVAIRQASMQHPQSSSYPSHHVRGLHTTVKRLDADHHSQPTAEPSELDEADLIPRLMLQPNNQDQVRNTMRGRVPVTDGLEDLQAPTQSFSAFSKALALRTQLDYLKSLPKLTALQVLGEGELDYSPSSFLKSFYEHFPAIAESSHWDCVIELHCFALSLNHPGYSRFYLRQQLYAMAASGVDISQETFLRVFEALLMAPHATDQASWKPGSHDALHALRKSLGIAFRVLELMEVYGHNICTEAVFSILHRSLIQPVFASSTHSGKGPAQPSSLPPTLLKEELERYQYLFRKALNALYTPPPTNSPIGSPEAKASADIYALYMSMLETYATQGNWKGFWDIWRQQARLMRPRTSEMYALMFRGVAQTGHQAHCTEVLSEHVPEMAREKPVVVLEGDVAAAVRECMIAAKVDVEGGEARWRQLWEKCERIRRRELELAGRRTDVEVDD